LAHNFVFDTVKTTYLSCYIFTVSLMALRTQLTVTVASQREQDACGSGGVRGALEDFSEQNI